MGVVKCMYCYAQNKYLHRHWYLCVCVCDFFCSLILVASWYGKGREWQRASCFWSDHMRLTANNLLVGWKWAHMLFPIFFCRQKKRRNDDSHKSRFSHRLQDRRQYSRNIYVSFGSIRESTQEKIIYTHSQIAMRLVSEQEWNKKKKNKWWTHSQKVRGKKVAE